MIMTNAAMPDICAIVKLCVVLVEMILRMKQELEVLNQSWDGSQLRRQHLAGSRPGSSGTQWSGTEKSEGKRES